MAQMTLTELFSQAAGESKNVFSAGSFIDRLNMEETQNTGVMASTGYGSKIIAMESLDTLEEAPRDSLSGVFASLKETLYDTAFESYAQDCGISPKVATDMQTAAGFIAIALEGNDGGSAYRQALRTVSERAGSLRENEFTIDHQFAGPHGVIPVISNENYDEKPSRGYRTLSVAYNLNAARQDPWGEGFYQTFVVNPTEGGVVQELQYTVVMQDAKHKKDGTIYDAKEINLVEAYRDPSILDDSVTRLVPVVNEQAVASAFVSSSLVAPYEVTDGRGTFKTAPIAVGKRFDLLALGNHDTSANTNIMDISDTLDPSMSLAAIYVKVGTKVIKLITDRLPRAKFQPALVADSRDINLNFESPSLVLTNKTKAVDGTAVPALATLADDETLYIYASMNGTISTSKGNGNITAGELLPSALYAQDGQERNLLSGTGLEVSTAFKDAEIVGFDLDARLTNKNRRERGQLLQTRLYRFRHPIPMSSPITHISSTLDPINQGAVVNALTVATNIRNSNNAVTTQLNYAEQLKAIVGTGSPRLRPGEIEGALSLMMRPTYRYQKIHVPDYVDTIRGKDRFDDISQTLINIIKAELFPAYRDSNIENAFRAISGNPDERPKFIIGCDMEIANYLMTSGDVRTLGAYLEYDIVVTNNEKFDGKIMVVATRKNAQPGDILCNGQFFYISSIVADLSFNRNDSVNREIAVIPYNLHVNNIPFLLEFDVTGLKAAAAEGRAASSKNLNGFDGVTNTGTTGTTGSTTGTGTTGSTTGTSTSTGTNGG